MKLNKQVFIAAVAFFCTACSIVSLLPNTNDVALLQVQNQSNGKEIYSAGKWANIPWTATSQPFKNIAARVDREMKNASPAELRVLVVNHEGKARFNPRSATAQYGWGYSLLKAAQYGLAPSKSSLQDVAREVSYAMAAAQAPRAYSYWRLFYLVSLSWDGNSSLVTLGERLLQKYPKDYTVKMRQTMLLSGNPDTQKSLRAIRYGEELVRDLPTNGDAWGKLAFAYWRRSRQTKKFSDADKAYRAAQRCLQLTSLKDKGRQQTIGFVNAVRRTREEYKNN